MAGFAVSLRPDPFFVRAYLQAGWAHEEAGAAGPSPPLWKAKRLDDQEAPQRDAARIASEEQAAKTKLKKRGL